LAVTEEKSLRLSEDKFERQSENCLPVAGLLVRSHRYREVIVTRNLLHFFEVHHLIAVFEVVTRELVSYINLHRREFLKSRVINLILLTICVFSFMYYGSKLKYV
jgi:hypothetical protein